MNLSSRHPVARNFLKIYFPDTKLGLVCELPAASVFLSNSIHSGMWSSLFKGAKSGGKIQNTQINKMISDGVLQETKQWDRVPG